MVCDAITAQPVGMTWLWSSNSENGSSIRVLIPTHKTAQLISLLSVEIFNEARFHNPSAYTKNRILSSNPASPKFYRLASQRGKMNHPHMPTTVYSRVNSIDKQLTALGIEP